jgi:hypothetical protein
MLGLFSPSPAPGDPTKSSAIQSGDSAPSFTLIPVAGFRSPTWLRANDHLHFYKVVPLFVFLHIFTWCWCFFFQSLRRCVPEQQGICSSSSAYSLTGTDTLAQCTCVAGDWRAVKQREYLGCGCVIPVSNLLLLSHGGIDVDLHSYVSHVQNYPCIVDSLLLLMVLLDINRNCLPVNIS